MELQATWNMAIKAWWSMAWRSLVISLVFAIVLGIISGILKVILERGFGVNPAFMTYITVMLSIIAGLAGQIWAMKKVLNMTFSNFEITTQGLR